MKRRRVAQVVSSLALGGAERCALELAARLDRSRHDSTLLVAGETASGPLAEIAAPQGLPVRTVQFRSLRHPADCARYIAVLRDFDIVHVHNRPLDYQTAALLAAAPPLLKRPRFFWTCHLPYPDLTRSTRFRYRMTARAARDTIACSPAVARHLTGTIGIPATSVHTLTNGVDLDRYHPLPPSERNRIRQSMNCEGKTVIISAGRLTAQKGFDRFLSALALLASHESLPPWEAWIAGGGPEHDRLRELIPGLRLESQVRLLGPRMDLHHLLAAADLFVLLSRFEGLPLALLEALACGLPAVVSGIPAFSLLEPDDAVSVSPDSADELEIATGAARHIRSLVMDPAERERRARKARQLVESRYDIRMWVKAHEQLYG